VARLSGDEFIVLLEEIHSLEDGRAVTRRLKARLKDPVDLKGTMVFPSASNGIVLPDHEYANAAEEIHPGETQILPCIMPSRTRKQDYVIFDQSMLQQNGSLQVLESELRQAIEKMSIPGVPTDLFFCRQKPDHRFRGAAPLAAPGARYCSRQVNLSMWRKETG
jgi:predicted signal transduction protein with EAL and GGDEF domain